MRKILKLQNICDKLAVDMWGEIKTKQQIKKGVYRYNCEYYSGIIFNDKEFDVDNKLKSRLNPMTIIEIYYYRNDKFIIERTDRKEKIPKKLSKKFKNKRYKERILIFALTGKSTKILRYYHKDVLREIYKKKLDKKSKKYKSANGYINNELKESIEFLSMNAPDFIKRKDRNKAKKFLDSKLSEEIKVIENDLNGNTNAIELIKDRFYQKRELIK